MQALDPGNYYDRLQIIAQAGKAAVKAGDEAEAARLREQWRATKAVIDAHQPCGRCHGSAATFKSFTHVYDGNCFRCGGSGLDPIKLNGEQSEIKLPVRTNESIVIRAARLAVDFTRPEYDDPDLLEDAIQAVHDRNFMAAWPR